VTALLASGREIVLGRRMAARFERPRSRAAGWARRVSVFAVILFLLAAVMHRTGALQSQNLVAISLLAALLAVAGLVLALVGLWGLWTSGAKGGRSAFWGMMLALMLLVPFGLAAARYAQLPRLYDISTDAMTAPRFLEVPGAAPGWLGTAARSQPLSASIDQRAAYPQLTGRRYEGAIDRVAAAVRRVAETRGIVVTQSEGADMLAPDVTLLPDTPEITDGAVPPAPDLDTLVPPLPVPAPRAGNGPAATGMPSRATLQGVAADPVFGFRSDIVIRLIEEEETTFVDMRAALRTGDHDLGLNAWHVSRFFGALDAELLGIATD
jgi:hypothetical protein